MASPEPTGKVVAAHPASVGGSSHSVGELQGSGQSQDFLSTQKANHHPRLRLSNSLPNGVWCALCHWDQCPSSGVQHTTVGGVGGTTGLAWCLGEPKRKKPVRGGVLQAGEFSCAPCHPLLKRNLALVVKWDGRMFPWHPEKVIPKVVLQPSP